MQVETLRHMLKQLRTPHDVAAIFQQLGYVINPLQVDAAKAYDLPAKFVDEYWLLGDTNGFQVHFFRIPEYTRRMWDTILAKFQRTDKFHLLCITHNYAKLLFLHQTPVFERQKITLKTQQWEITPQDNPHILANILADLDITHFTQGDGFAIDSQVSATLTLEKVTRKFYKEFQDYHASFLQFITGIPTEKACQWYVSVILNRLMFIYFLQKKGFIDNDQHYLRHKYEQFAEQGRNYYREFLCPLFFNGFAKPSKTTEFVREFGDVPYLNGGLFLQHELEKAYQIAIANQAFDDLLAYFDRYTWYLDDRPVRAENEINPDVIGYIFEKYINQKAFGAYYTRPEITTYLCEQTIYKLIADRLYAQKPESDRTAPHTLPALLMHLDAESCQHLLFNVLPELTLLDPACGSGAFLVAALKTLINVYAVMLGRITFLRDAELTAWKAQTEAEHPSLPYYVKKRIITDNLFGVDIMEEATEIAKLRLFLSLVASVVTRDQLEPLPNVDFNILAGNSLIGLLGVNAQEFEQYHTQLDLFDNHKTYPQILADKNEAVRQYKEHAFDKTDLAGLLDQNTQLLQLREHIQKVNTESQHALNLLLLDEFKRLKIKFEAAQLTGKPQKRDVTVEDIARLKPFHWAYHFDVIVARGGFDAIITNPPWEIFKPNAKEFFADYSDVVTKNKMDIKTFEKEQTSLLKTPEIADAWLDYQSQYPHVSQFFRTSEQYKNQIAVVHGKKAGTDINLYKLFLEQCYNLLRHGGECGIVLPSGIYTDLGTKQLRQMLFGHTTVTGLFCFENRKKIFEGVDSRFKFVVLTFEKSGTTTAFPAAFMRHDVAELQHFPQAEQRGLIRVDLIQKLSPDSLSVMEFRDDMEYQIAQKIVQFPLLDSEQSCYKHIKFNRELAPDSNSDYFKTSPQKGFVPVLEGKMIHQFNHIFSRQYRYWIKPTDARKIILGKIKDSGQLLDSQVYRLAFRKIARNTDERTMISTIIPPSFCAESLQTIQVLNEHGETIVSLTDMLCLCAMWNSFVFDFTLRMKVSANINFFFLYSTQTPCLKKGDPFFDAIVRRAARLICTTPEFDALAQAVRTTGIWGKQESERPGVTNEYQRSVLRAELDGLIAHVYGLSEDEFTYILRTFPIVSQPVKVSAHNAYRDVERGLMQ